MGRDSSPADVFVLLADEIRVEILKAIAVADNESDALESGTTELSFSDIYERVDVDNTSKLSYHLGELIGPFLRKGENGYMFTHAGEQFVRMILADNYEQPRAFDPIEIEGQCLFCESTTLEAHLQHQFFFVRCQECDRPLSGHPTPPTLVRSADGLELVDRIGTKMALDYRQIRTGICIACSGPLSTTVMDADETPLPDFASFLVRDECQECLRQYSGPLTYAVAYHPASIAFHWERGIDLSTSGMWELHEHATDEAWTAEQLPANPDEYRVVMRHDREALHVYLDADVTVTRTERVRNRTVD